jgi:site-specific DNA recombinase
MSRVIGYVRVSSEMQKEKDNSIRSQIKSIKKYCDDYGLELVGIYKDEGISGLKSNRDGLNRMLTEIKKLKVDMVLVYSLSRLGRKLVDVVGWVNDLESKGIRFISIKENFTNEGVMGKLMMGILGSVNEFEVGILGERIRDVKQFKKSKMEVYGGPICYGWERDGKILIENWSEMEVLKEIHDLRIHGWSYNRISQKLNKIGIVSKSGGKWYSASVRSVYLNGVINI